MQLPLPSGIVTLLTDFGVRDPYVGLVKGMIKRAFGRADVIDLCHEVPPQAVQVGAFFLGAAIDRFPVGTVHVGVVDPGVGSDRRFLAVYSHRCFWIGPDNGVLSAVLPRSDVDGEVRAVEPERLKLMPESSTFHARDVFGPLAGLLAMGRYGYRAVGPRIDDPVQLPPITEGNPRVVVVDHFGNLITNCTGARVDADGCRSLEIDGRLVPFLGTYSEGQPGEPLALINSYGLVEVAVRDGSAARTLGAEVGATVALRKEGA